MKAKLQRQLAYKYKEKHHYKHVIVVPDEAITELGWKGGQELELKVKGGQLIATLKKESGEKGEGVR
jgi:bifunctional DNA-binding transcriptional regulator/antitoxin component of YhaV-PrlF toxin-antitoxin module